MSRSKKKHPRSHRTRPVPTEQDWGDYRSDLDQNHAHSVFARRTNEEMQLFFRRNVIEMTDSLRWMPDVPFRYYMLGFRDFVMSKNLGFLGSADAANCFLGLVFEKLEKQPNQILPIMPNLVATLEYVARNQKLFDADEGIYGDFSEKVSQIKDAYAGHRNSDPRISKQNQNLP